MVIYNEIEFLPILNFEGYFASQCGKVLSIRGNAKILKPRVNSNGYEYLNLYKNNKRETKKIHRLVAMTFLEDYTEDLSVDHKDNNKLNNNLDNLRMVTPSDNNRNKKNAVGVCKDLDKRQNHYNWRAHWRDETGKSKNKSFSVNKYGELFAYLLATEYRQEMVDKYYNRP